jgi:antirestriction protein
MKIRQLEPRICVGSLSAYNNGILLYEWIDATLDLEELKQQVLEISEGDEFIIFDYEDFGAISIQEFESLEKVNAIALSLECDNAIAFSLYYEHFVDSLKDFETDKIYDKFESAFEGEYNNANDFVENLLENCLPSELEKIKLFGSPISYYLDTDKIKRDLELCGDYTFLETESSVFVFNNF